MIIPSLVKYQSYKNHIGTKITLKPTSNQTMRFILKHSSHFTTAAMKNRHRSKLIDNV